MKLTSATTTSIFVATTNSAGVAEFTVTAGIYTAEISEKRTVGATRTFFNGNKSIVVADDWADLPVALELTASESRAVIIKELYNGGCQKDDGSGAFQNDKYIILYNNSDETVSLKNLSFGAAMPLNGHATNNFPQIDGKPEYFTLDWTPVAYGLWTLESDMLLESGKQIVISLENSIDNTQTYSNSINFANPDYYAAYDIAVWTNTTYYKVADAIPTSHYLKGYKLPNVTSNALTLSVSSPAVFIFQPSEEINLADYLSNPDNIVLHGTSASQANLKVKTKWILDGIEVFQQGKQIDSKKRLPDAVDAGYIYLTNNQGYTLYRNVDKEATEAIAENAGKIVYNYNKGTTGIVPDGTTDPSDIDAEASIKNGARIIYLDSNNSTNDFHQRKQASLKDNN
jgi:hypothetical protein